jgi:ergothioneine biosynthesis protein EgtC
MCRLLGYLGQPIRLDQLLYQPDHSLVIQSYQPREMTSGLLNADGFGIGWYHTHRCDSPFTYRNTLPIWNDPNLPGLSRYIESHCMLASVRSATPGLSVNLNNCPPFQHNLILAVHNGFVENFRATLYRPLRDRLSDDGYQSIQGTTDSEHLIALVVNEWARSPEFSLAQALKTALNIVFELADIYQVSVSANLILSQGDRLIACRAANRLPTPTLYWLRDHALFPKAVVIASEPLFTGDWVAVPDQTILTVGDDLELEFQTL